MKIGLEFKPADFWIGVYTEERINQQAVTVERHVWLCLLPMLPIHAQWTVR